LLSWSIAVLSMVMMRGIGRLLFFGEPLGTARPLSCLVAKRSDRVQALTGPRPKDRLLNHPGTCERATERRLRDGLEKLHLINNHLTCALKFWPALTDAKPFFEPNCHAGH
jgi:hypothetical protein